MPRLTTLSRLSVFATSGKTLGWVSHVLFHPTQPHVVGFEVRRPNLLLVVSRKPRYVLRERLTAVDGRLVLDSARLPSVRAGESALGHTWDETVIWLGMPVKTAEGVPAGTVADALVSLRTGELKTLEITGGVTSDVAVGRREIAGSHVKGFDGESVLIEDLADDVGYSGGVAAAAGKGAGAAKVHAERLAKKAAVYGSATAKVVRESDAAKKAADALRSFGQTVREAMEPDEDD